MDLCAAAGKLSKNKPYNNNSCTNKMYIGHMNSQRLIRACTLANYTLDLDLVLEAIGVQLDVHLVLICKPGVPS